MSSSAYNGRRGPNVTQYLRNLNSSGSHDAAPPSDDGLLEDDLSLFANTQFFDFDLGQDTDFQPQPIKVDIDGPSSTPPEELTAQTTTIPDISAMDFAPDFNFPLYDSAYTSPTVSGFPEETPNLQPIQPNSSRPFNPTAPGRRQSAFGQGTMRPTDKRKTDIAGSGRHGAMEETSRLAAEEDKRRRNTAASARFRVKKKQREQALEKSAKDLTEKVVVLEGRIQQLETENKWLKNLVMEKNGGKEDIALMLKEFGSRQIKDRSCTGEGDDQEPVALSLKQEN